MAPTKPINPGKKLILIAFVALLAFRANTQQIVPRNYVGLASIYEAWKLSIGGSVEYERWLFVKEKWVFATRAQYIFPHKTLNLVLRGDDLSQSNSQGLLFATAYIFTSQKKNHTGFFVGLSPGLSRIRSQTTVYNDNAEPHDEINASILPGFEVSLGAQWKVGSRFAVRFATGTSQFFSKQQTEFFGNVPLVLIFSKLSFGF
ncbi:MAG: hypothetical protein ACHQFX_06215 [Chitinophagales bacterium]